MTTVQHDEVTTTVLEDAVSELEESRPSLAAVADPRPELAVVPDPPRRHLAPVGARARTAAGDPTREARAPRLRLVPAAASARRATAPPAAAPVTLGQRAGRPPLHVVLDEGDERGAAPTTDPGRFVHGVGLACVEVVLGRRPAAQLARWVTPDVLEDLQARAELVRRTGVLAHARRPAARRVRVSPVDAHTAEACLVVDDGVRVRAVAARLEAHRGAWRLTTLQIG